MSAGNCVNKVEEILSDDEDYFSCLSELAPFASNECLYGGGFGLDDRFYGLEEVDARFDKSVAGSTGIKIIPLQNDSAEDDDKVLDDIRYLFGDFLGVASMSSFGQVQPSSTESQSKQDTAIDWTRFFGLREVIPVSVVSPRRTSETAVNIWLENYLRTLDHSDSEDETTEGFNECFPDAESYPRHEGVKEWKSGTPGDLGNGVEQTEDLPAPESPPKPRERSTECATGAPLRSPRLVCGIMLRTESDMIFDFDKSYLSELKSGLSEESGLNRMRAENAIYGYEPSIDDLRDDVEDHEPKVVEDLEAIPDVKRKSRFHRFISSICRMCLCSCLKRKLKERKDDKADGD